MACRILPLVSSAAAMVAAILVLHPVPVEAAPKRTYVCNGGQVVVTVLSQKKIRVVVDMPGSSEGKFTMEMMRQGKRFHFANGEYEVKVTQEQNELTYNAPDFGTAVCNWEGY